MNILLTRELCNFERHFNNFFIVEETMANPFLESVEKMTWTYNGIESLVLNVLCIDLTILKPTLSFDDINDFEQVLNFSDWVMEIARSFKLNYTQCFMLYTNYDLTVNIAEYKGFFRSTEKTDDDYPSVQVYKVINKETFKIELEGWKYR